MSCHLYHALSTDGPCQHFQASRCPVRTSLFKLCSTSERFLSLTCSYSFHSTLKLLGSRFLIFLGISVFFCFQIDFGKNLLFFHSFFQILMFWLNRAGKGDLVASLLPSFLIIVNSVGLIVTPSACVSFTVKGH